VGLILVANFGVVSVGVFSSAMACFLEGCVAP
jgi:hypothetical protein